MKEVWERESISQDKAMLWAAASLCFFGFLRSGEVCIPGEKAFDKGAHLTMQDIHVDNLANPQSVQVRSSRIIGCIATLLHIHLFSDPYMGK